VEQRRTLTPTGLFKALAFLGWKDVTANDYERTATLALRDDPLAAANCAQAFTFWKVLIAIERKRVRDRLDGIALRLHRLRESNGG